MLETFDRQKIIDNSIKYEQSMKKYREALNEYKQVIQLLDLKKKEKNTIITNSRLLAENQPTSIFSRIASLFGRGKYYDTNKKKQEQSKALASIEQEIFILDNQAATLNSNQIQLKQECQNKTLPEYLSVEDDTIVITDTAEAKYEPISTRDAMDKKPKVLVHCTNYFPSNGTILSDFDGNKITTHIMHYNGISKEVQKITHRPEVHFTINSRVENTSSGEGNWDNPSYIVVESYDAHKDEMEEVDPSDSWTCGTSMHLSKNAVILVKKQDKDKLPPDQDKYNILYYDGNATICLRNFLIENGYEVFSTDANSAVHSQHLRMTQEGVLDARDAAVNFCTDDAYLTKDLPVLSINELAQIINVYNENASSFLSASQISQCENTNLSAEENAKLCKTVEFLISSGLKKLEDGMYTFSSENEVLQNIEMTSKARNALPDFVDLKLAKQIFEIQKQIDQEHINAELPSIDSFSTYSLQQLYKFKNQLACEALAKSLPDDTVLTKLLDRVVVEKISNDHAEVAKKLTAEDDIRHVSISGDIGYLVQDINDTESVGSANNIITDMDKTLETIKARTPKKEKETDSYSI